MDKLKSGQITMYYTMEKYKHVYSNKDKIEKLASEVAFFSSDTPVTLDFTNVFLSDREEQDHLHIDHLSLLIKKISDNIEPHYTGSVTITNLKISDVYFTNLVVVRDKTA